MLRAIDDLGWNRELHYPQRGALVAKHGMVASTNPVTSRVGLDILRRGGNAVDAAVAMAATHTVVEPGVGHLGGDTFMLIHVAAKGRTFALNGNGAAPLQASADFYRAQGGIPAKGPLAASIPGTVSSWVEANERFGSLRLKELLHPAVELPDQDLQSRIGWPAI